MLCWLGDVSVVERFQSESGQNFFSFDPWLVKRLVVFGTKYVLLAWLLFWHGRRNRI